MKKTLVLSLCVFALSGCTTLNPFHESREGAQDGEKSPCACLDYEIFNGKVYEFKTKNA